MKKNIVLIIALSLISIVDHAQISTKQQPRSFKVSSIAINSINEIVLNTPDISAVLNEQQQKANLFKPQSCAVLIPVNESFFDRASRVTLADAYIYMLKIRSEGALALNLYSDDFYIPQGCELYVWNTDKSKCLGAYTSDNNSSDGYFATDYVYGEEMIIEYYQPFFVSNAAKINIQSIGYFYRDIINFEQESLAAMQENTTADAPYKTGFKSSGSCNVNVNCSEGDNFRNQQHAVVRMLVPINSYESGWCTGTLINNTNYDNTPYVFSAAHCIEEIKNKSYYSQIVFYFNYEASGCSNPSKEPGYNSLTGAEVLAYDNKFGYGGSDYLLMKLKNTVPQSYNPFFAGWTRSEELASGAVCIHHPSGDVKKISTVSGKVQDIGYDEGVWDYDTHWMTLWAKTGNGYGVTEGGSSGSGLFNSKGMLIGSLSGGESSCYASNSNKVDWYGRFYVTYNYIKKWLDPKNSNVQEIGGKSYTVGLDETSLSEDNITVYPVPATDYVNVNIENPKENAVLSVLDNLGRSVYWQKINAVQKDYKIDVTSFDKGTYYIRIYSNGNSVIKKIIVE